jgi:lambda family phage portal protein
VGWFDNVIATLSPRRAYERELWRQGLNDLRGYDAASYGRINAGWRVMNESAETTDRHSRDVIRARARDLERNSDIAQSILHAYKRNVVGKGYTLRALTGNDSLDKQIEQAWKRWCKARNCDVTGEQSFNEILRMMVERKKVDGGMIVLYRYTAGGVVPFKLQCLEVDELDQTQAAPHQRGNRLVGGIEYNRNRRPVGYWIRQYDIEGWQLTDPVYIEAKDVFFYKSKHRPSQLREVSDLSPTITRVRDTNEFINAVAIKERISALVGLVIKKNLPSGGAGRSSWNGKGGQVDYSAKKMTPGMIMELGAGDDVEVVDPKGAATDATAFLKTQQGLIGAGQGLSYEAISRDMHGATYSSARQNALEDENSYTEEIELLTAFMSEVYENFLISGYLSGLFSIHDFWERKEDYMEHSWVKTPKKWIDPAKEANADKVALQSGQKTFQDLQAEKGKDWKEAIDEMAEVMEYGKEKGIDMGGVIFGTGTTGTQQSGTGAGKEPGNQEHGNDPGPGGEQPGGDGQPPADD